jgi:hypothetical protein
MQTALMTEEPLNDDELWQSENLDYIDRVVEAASTSTIHAGAEVRPDTQELILYGAGFPEQALVSIMNEAPPNIRVVWHEAPFTLTELLSEVDRILTRATDVLNSGWPLHDGTGIGFTTTDPALLAADDPQAAVGARFPVTFEYGGPAIPV